MTYIGPTSWKLESIKTEKEREEIENNKEKQKNMKDATTIKRITQD